MAVWNEIRKGIQKKLAGFLPYKKWKHLRWISKQEKEQTEVVIEAFSPATYRNPFIGQIRHIVNEILSKRDLTYQKLELVVIDLECPANENTFENALDDADIQSSLSQLTVDLNSLQLLTDRPVFYKDFVHHMYMEYGLIVQRIPKAEARCVQGNFILDFERNENTYEKAFIKQKSVYLPIYKKPWEIGENLDIIVPVGYNTLIVTGYQEPEKNKETTNEDRLDQEFRRV